MTEAVRATDLGIAEHADSALSTEQAERLAATLDVDDPPPEGAALPLLWHWAYFTPTAASADLGPDGHPRLPADGPTSGLPRRMFAGGEVRELAPLLAGIPAERSARLTALEPKTGRSGRLLLATVETEIIQGGETKLIEQQTLVYREPGAPLPAPRGSHTPATPAGGWCERHTLDRVRLFRFSAVTFNAHRIHYDAEYATGEEGYPGLVVHGPLIALLLAESARTRMGPLSRFRFRATAPLFEGLAFSIVGEPADGELNLTAIRNDGQTAMEATAVAG